MVTVISMLTITSKGVSMNISQMYIALSIIILAIIVILIFFLGRKRKDRGLSQLASFAFAFVLAGILFGENRLVGYSLMGIGVLLAAIDIFKKLKKN
jgi:uncharacterized membrane protein